jgi:hypothetical protein
MSSDGKLSIILEKRLDENNNVYHIGRLKGPISIDAREGVCFLIFTAFEGEEEMQIGSMTNAHNHKKGAYDERK